MKRGSLRQSIAVSAFLFFLSGEASAESLPNPLLSNKDAEKTYRVEKVLRADAIILDTNQKIRLIGLNAPYTPRPKEVKKNSYGIIIEEITPLSTIEERAIDFAKRLLEGKYVRLEFDAENKDENFYTYAYVFLPDGTFANEEILRYGFANLKIIPPNTKYADTFRRAYQEARREKRGLQGE